MGGVRRNLLLHWKLKLLLTASTDHASSKGKWRKFHVECSKVDRQQLSIITKNGPNSQFSPNKCL